MAARTCAAVALLSLALALALAFDSDLDLDLDSVCGCKLLQLLLQVVVACCLQFMSLTAETAPSRLSCRRNWVFNHLLPFPHCFKVCDNNNNNNSNLSNVGERIYIHTYYICVYIYIKKKGKFLWRCAWNKINKLKDNGKILQKTWSSFREHLKAQVKRTRRKWPRKLKSKFRF